MVSLAHHDELGVLAELLEQLGGGLRLLCPPDLEGRVELLDLGQRRLEYRSPCSAKRWATSSLSEPSTPTTTMLFITPHLRIVWTHRDPPAKEVFRVASPQFRERLVTDRHARCAKPDRFERQQRRNARIVQCH